MKRHAFAMKIHEGQTGKFRENLGAVWHYLTDLLDEKKITNFSLWSAGGLVFGYYESPDDLQFTKKDREWVLAWPRKWENTFEWISTPYGEMRLMYQDFGIVRKNKELIRHRVFITRLNEGAEEEYKARHDALVRARGDQVTQGPDSNFSIWYAGGYIFGYNEIDTTMEKDETKEEREETIRWETGMLEIMSWITDDVDWITGEQNEHIQKLAWH